MIRSWFPSSPIRWFLSFVGHQRRGKWSSVLSNDLRPQEGSRHCVQSGQRPSGAEIWETCICEPLWVPSIQTILHRIVSDARRYSFLDGDRDDRDLWFLPSRGVGVFCTSLSLWHRIRRKCVAETTEVWTAVPGVASTALQTELKDKIDPSDWKASNKRRDELSALLAMKPLSSVDWLSLSRINLVTAQPRAQILETLMLSWVTGPNEGYVMAERGIFGLSLWEVLSPDLRSRAALDLAKDEITDSVKIRAVLSTKPEGVQNEIRTVSWPQVLRRKRLNDGSDFSLCGCSQQACRDIFATKGRAKFGHNRPRLGRVTRTGCGFKPGGRRRGLTLHSSGRETLALEGNERWFLVHTQPKSERQSPTAPRGARI